MATANVPHLYDLQVSTFWGFLPQFASEPPVKNGIYVSGISRIYVAPIQVFFVKGTSLAYKALVKDVVRAPEFMSKLSQSERAVMADLASLNPPSFAEFCELPHEQRTQIARDAAAVCPGFDDAEQSELAPARQVIEQIMSAVKTDTTVGGFNERA